MKIFSSMLYIVLEQQWISSTMTTNCQWSSRSRTILKRIAADSESIIAENALRTSTNKEIWIASILSNWETMRLNFRISHTKEMWDKRKNECQELQSFLHMLIVVLSLRVVTTVFEEVVTRRSRWYTEKAWAHLLYLTSSHTSIYVENRELKRTIRTHSLSSIRVKHRTIAIARLY